MSQPHHRGRIFRELPFHRAAVVCVGELPFLDDIQRLASRPDSACLAQKRQGLLQIPGIDVDRPLNHAVSAVFELHQRQPDVLSLDIAVGLAVGVGKYLRHLAAHEPAEDIDLVNALVHQRAAVRPPGAPPFRRVIVGLVPVPVYPGAAVEHPPEPPRVHRGFDGLHRRIQPVLVAHAHLDVPFLRRGNDGVSMRQRQGNGLFNDEIRPHPDAIQGNAGLHAAARGDGNQIRPLFREHILVVPVHLHPLPLGLRDHFQQGRNPSIHNIAQRNNLQSRIQRRCDMLFRDRPAPNHRKFHHNHLSFCCVIAGPVD